MRHFDRIFQLFTDPEDSGSGGGAPEWPDYQVPDGVGAGDQPDRDVTAGPTSAGDSTVPGGEAQPQASNDGAGDQRPGGEAPNGHQPAGNLPQGRLEQELGELRQQNAALHRQFAEQTRLLTGLRNVFAPPAPVTDPKTLALRNRLMEVIPEFKDLLEIAKHREGLISNLNSAPGRARTEAIYWDGVAARNLATLHTEIAPYMLGDGGTADKLSEAQKGYLAKSFQEWCIADQTGARVDRYERGDAKVVEEFRDFFVALHYAPARRQAVLSAVARATAGGATPRAGRADATATSVPKTDPSDEDAVHSRGWANVQNAFAGRR